MGKGSPAVIAYVSEATWANPLALQGRLHAAHSKRTLQMLFGFGASLPLEKSLLAWGRCVNIYSKLAALAAKRQALCPFRGGLAIFMSWYKRLLMSIKTIENISIGVQIQTNDLIIYPIYRISGYHTAILHQIFLKWCNKSESFLNLLPLDISTQMGWLTSTMEAAERALPHRKTCCRLQVCQKQIVFVLLSNASGLEDGGLTHQGNWCQMPAVNPKVKSQMIHLGTHLLGYSHTHPHMHTHLICRGKTTSNVFLLMAQRGKAFAKKQRHLERFGIRLIRFVFCLLFRRHDQSDISPICVSSRGEEEEFGECCLLISSGWVRCTLGMVIKTRK